MPLRREVLVGDLGFGQGCGDAELQVIAEAVHGAELSQG